MTYTPDSPLIGYQPPRAGWQDALTAHGAANVAQIIAAYAHWCGRYGIDANLALAQAVHETGWFSSARWRQEHNPAGLGITADNTPPNPFASDDEGIRAHIEHLCCYVYTAATCPCDHGSLADRRHWFHDGIPTLSSLERPGVRQWAYPGTGYLDSICQIAKSIGGTMSAQPTAADIGYPVEYHPAQAHGGDHPITDVRWFVVHDTQGGYDGSLSVLTGPNVSAHALIRRDGLLAFLLPIIQSAWAAGNLPVNNQAIQVELENADYHSNDYTDAQYRSLAAFFRWCQGQGMTVPPVYIGRVDKDGGIEPDVAGIIGHQDVPDGAGGWGGSDHHTDPGPPFDWARFVGLVTGAVTPPPPPPDTFFVDGNPHGQIPVKMPFWNRWNYLNTLGLALPMMGYPIAAETTLASGRRVQQFERGWYGTQDAADPWNVVQLLLSEVVPQ